MPAHEVYTGVIARVVPDRGFYFIEPDGGGRSVFLHIKALQRAMLGEPSVGDRIRYSEVENNGRVEAKPTEFIT